MYALHPTIHPTIGRWSGFSGLFPLWLAAVMGWATAGSVVAGTDSTVPITVINYSKLPVYAAGIALEESLFRGPVRVRPAEGGEALPLSRGREEGRSVLRLCVSLPPGSRLNLVAEPVEHWEQKPPVSAQPGMLRNGVVRWAPGKKGWKFGFDTERATLIEDGLLDFWVDNQNRGRIANISPDKLGLSRAGDGQVQQSEALISPEGRPTFRVVRRLQGLAKDMTVTETFELVPGMPLLICRVRWQNDGDAPLWIAYAGSGDGIRGKWSKELLPTPLIERKKSPTQGDLNGGETRCAWLGALCRISMESAQTGCGVGLSTLLPTPGKVGQGSMVWGCGAGGFQCNFIDPVQGQFPFLVKPHGTLDNGIVFLAAQAGTMVFRQTADLWKALQSEKLPVLAPPCAVFVDGKPVQAQLVRGLEKTTDNRLALRLDFNQHYECTLTGATRVMARPLVSGKKPVTLVDAGQPASLTLDLNERLGWKDEVPFVIETSAGTAVAINESLPVSPRMLSPVADAALTDISAMFRWAALPLVTDYEVQWSRAEDFSDPVSVRVTSSQDYPWYLVPENRLPAPGKWHWRIRGIKNNLTGAWSEPQAFTVNNEHPLKPVKRPVTARNPLFTLEATQILDYTRFHPDIDADLAPQVGMIAEGMESKGVLVTDFARGMETLPYAILLRSHWVGLADIEWLFQHVPNFVGIQGGEKLSSLSREDKEGDMNYHHRLTRLCAKYGMFYQEADGTYKDDKWQDLMDKQGAFVRQYGAYLILSQKNNIIRRQFYSQSAAMGLWLGGVISQHGAWEDGGFYWQNAGFKELGVCAGERSGVLSTMPRIFWDLVCVMGISRGCGIYSLDGQTLMYGEKAAARDPKGPWRSAIWSDKGKMSDTFNRFVAPLIRGTVAHELIPTREQVLKNVKLAVYNDQQVAGDEKTWTHYAEYGPLYAATYSFRKMGNIDGQLYEFFPNTGRYYFIPVLPQGNEPLGGGIKNLPVSQLQSTAKVSELFDAAYPKSYEGDAFAVHVGDTLVVLNTRENEDVTESYSMPLGAGFCQSVSGKIGPHAYVVGKIEKGGQQLWLQANTEYPERDTEWVIGATQSPACEVTPPEAVKSRVWDDKRKALTLKLSHAGGAVEVLVRRP